MELIIIIAACGTAENLSIMSTEPLKDGFYL